LLKRAASYYEQAIALDQGNRTAHQRLGMLAMDARSFGDAVAHLEAAYETDPTNAATRKALGLTYTWTDHLYQAEQLLADVPDIVEELNVWGWWWGTQGEYEWAANAYRVSLRLRPNQPSVREALADVGKN
jgi:tetratricopeptide (TPR) repeat protein